jgi:AcrR family transcriptional regulator
MVYAVKSMARPRSLTDARIAAAVLAVVDRDGLAALSMRAVAHELGFGTMSLYRYVTGREDLERRVVDAVLGTVNLALPPDTSWSERVTLLIERVRDAVSAHPSVVPLVVTHRHASVGVFRWAETVLGVLTEAGFGGERRVIAFRALLSYVTGVLQYQQLGPLSGHGTEALAALPDAAFPLLTETARQARQIEPDDEFHGGLALVLRGLAGDVLPRRDELPDFGAVGPSSISTE